MPFQTVFIVLSFLGIIDAGYLAYKHLQKKPLICPMNAHCSVVTDSKWSHMFGVRNEFLGVVYYVGLFFCILATFLFPQFRQLLFLALVLGTTLGFLFSLFLVFLQAAVIKNYCFYCMISALISFLLFLDSLTLFFA